MVQNSYRAINAGIVTRCLLKLLYGHHATCAVLAIQKSML